jgi:hypothetical protein
MKRSIIRGGKIAPGWPRLAFMVTLTGLGMILISGRQVLSIGGLIGFTFAVCLIMCGVGISYIRAWMQGRNIRRE